MEFVSKGPGEKGIVWVARRVPDDGATAHANQARIRTWPRDNATAMWAHDVVDFAVRKKLYPKDADPLAFSFSDTFDPVGARMHATCLFAPRISTNYQESRSIEHFLLA